VPKAVKNARVSMENSIIGALPAREPDSLYHIKQKVLKPIKNKL